MKVQSPYVDRYELRYSTVDDALASNTVHAQSANSMRRCVDVARYGMCRSNILDSSAVDRRQELYVATIGGERGGTMREADRLA